MNDHPSALPSCEPWKAQGSQQPSGRLGAGVRAAGNVASVVSTATPWTAARHLLCAWDSPGKNTGVGCFPTQGLNKRLSSGQG